MSDDPYEDKLDEYDPKEDWDDDEGNVLDEKAYEDKLLKRYGLYIKRS